MSKDNKKDIYEIFNDIEFDVSEFEVIELNELEVVRLKKDLKARTNVGEGYNVQCEKRETVIGKKGKKGWIKAASIAVGIALVLGFTKTGREVLAQIADKLFFTPSQGVIKGEQWGNTYVLEEPKRVDINGESTLIKNIINSGDYISVEMWTDEVLDENNPKGKEEYDLKSNEKINDFKEKLKIKDSSGKTLSVKGYVMASGGYTVIEFSQEGNLITDFDLYYGDDKIEHFTLSKVKYVDSYDELGGNATNNEILIGATSYYIEGERYFKLWSNKDGINLPDYTMTIDHYNDVEARDDNGNLLNIESANDGTGKAYKLLDDYEGNIHISIEEVDLGYRLKEGGTISLKMPDKGETVEINKEVKLKGLEDKIVVKSITNNNGEHLNGDYIITLDYSNNYDESRFIYMSYQSFRSGGSMGDPENKLSEIYLDSEDLSVSEKLRGKIKLRLDEIKVKQYGNWKFIVQ